MTLYLIYIAIATHACKAGSVAACIFSAPIANFLDLRGQNLVYAPVRNMVIN